MSRDIRLAGVFAFIGITQFILLFHMAEFLYPNYSVANNYISDLGVGPSAIIFNGSIIILGLLGTLASLLLLRSGFDKVFSVLLLITSLGAMGVGFFPENMGVLHAIPSFITFLFAGFSALYSYKIDDHIFRYFWPLLGVISLLALVLFASKMYLGLGRGGMERLIVYPVFVWLIGLSANIAHRKNSFK